MSNGLSIEPLALAYERESVSTLSKSEEAALRAILNKLLGAADRGAKLMAMQQRPSSR